MAVVGLQNLDIFLLARHTSQPSALHSGACNQGSRRQWLVIHIQVQ